PKIQGTDEHTRAHKRAPPAYARENAERHGYERTASWRSLCPVHPAGTDTSTGTCVHRRPDSTCSAPGRRVDDSTRTRDAVSRCPRESRRRSGRRDLLLLFLRVECRVRPAVRDHRLAEAHAQLAELVDVLLCQVGVALVHE